MLWPAFFCTIVLSVNLRHILKKEKGPHPLEAAPLKKKPAIL
ncbi:hypothetical protein BH09BAC1_BH09BAC1_26980 [soil metagenome]